MGIQLSKPALDVGIVTANYDRMRAFYGDLLGFEELDPIAFPGAGTVHRFVVGQSILRLFEPPQAPPNPNPTDSMAASTGIRYMTLVADNLREVVDACRAFGANVPAEPREIRPGVSMCQVQDPDGNWIELQGS